MAGIWLVAAAGLFWISWALMPGVGVTDPEQIFQLVTAHRPLVALSVVLQLSSAVCYIPALLGLAGHSRLGRSSHVRWGAGLLIAGAMGSAADAVLHLLAYAMTTPGLDRAPLVPVMAFMQGPGLLLLAPLVLSFFVGGGVLSFALAKLEVVPPWNVRLHVVAVCAAVLGGGLARLGVLPPRAVGLTFLALVSAAQIWAGFRLRSRRVGTSAYLASPAEPSGYPSPRIFS